MKKKYVKPDAEYIALEAMDIVTDIINMDPSMSMAVPDDFE